MDKESRDLERKALNNPIAAKRLELMEYRLGQKRFIEAVKDENMIADKSLLGKKVTHRGVPGKIIAFCNDESSELELEKGLYFYIQWKHSIKRLFWTQIKFAEEA